MNVASLVLSAIGAFLSLISIYITIKLTKRTSELRKEIKTKYDNSRAINRFNEKKYENLSKINEIKEAIISNINEELSLKTLDDLHLFINRIQKNLSPIQDKRLEDGKKVIENLKSILENTNLDAESKNKMILENLREIIVFLESYEYIE